MCRRYRLTGKCGHSCFAPLPRMKIGDDGWRTCAKKIHRGEKFCRDTKGDRLSTYSYAEVDECPLRLAAGSEASSCEWKELGYRWICGQCMHHVENKERGRCTECGHWFCYVYEKLETCCSVMPQWAHERLDEKLAEKMAQRLAEEAELNLQALRSIQDGSWRKSGSSKRGGDNDAHEGKGKKRA